MANFRAKTPQNRLFTKKLTSLPAWGKRGRAGWAKQAGRGTCGLVPGLGFPHTSLGQAQAIKLCTGGLLTSCERTINAHSPEMPGLRLIVLEMFFSSDLILRVELSGTKPDVWLPSAQVCAQQMKTFFRPISLH